MVQREGSIKRKIEDRHSQTGDRLRIRPLAPGPDAVTDPQSDEPRKNSKRHAARLADPLIVDGVLEDECAPMRLTHVSPTVVSILRGRSETVAVGMTGGGGTGAAESGASRGSGERDGSATGSGCRGGAGVALSPSACSMRASRCSVRSCRLSSRTMASLNASMRSCSGLATIVDDCSAGFRHATG